MNRRGFITQFFQGAVTAIAAPQIITHGLKLWKPKRQFMPVMGIYEEMCLYRPSFIPENFSLEFFLNENFRIHKERLKQGPIPDTIEFWLDARAS